MMALLLTVVMFFAAAPLLQLVHTPDDLFPMALTYIHIIFLWNTGKYFVQLFGKRAACFGDSRHPFYFLLISSLLNILLDYLLIVHFHMGRRRRRMGDRSQSTDQRTVKYMVAFKQNRTD